MAPPSFLRTAGLRSREGLFVCFIGFGDLSWSHSRGFPDLVGEAWLETPRSPRPVALASVSIKNFIYLSAAAAQTRVPLLRVRWSLLENNQLRAAVVL